MFEFLNTSLCVLAYKRFAKRRIYSLYMLHSSAVQRIRYVIFIIAFVILESMRQIIMFYDIRRPKFLCLLIAHTHSLRCAADIELRHKYCLQITQIIDIKAIAIRQLLCPFSNTIKENKRKGSTQWMRSCVARGPRSAKIKLIACILRVRWASYS